METTAPELVTDDKLDRGFVTWFNSLDKVSLEKCSSVIHHHRFLDRTAGSLSAPCIMMV